MTYLLGSRWYQAEVAELRLSRLGFRTKPQRRVARTLTPADLFQKGEPTVGLIDIWANVHPRAFTPGAPL